MSNTETIIENTGKQEFAELLCDFMFSTMSIKVLQSKTAKLSLTFQHVAMMDAR